MKFYIIIIFFSALLDIVANLLLKKSNGFKDKRTGFLAIFCVVLAFLLLSISLNYVPLSVAYSTWGAIGIIGTCVGGYILYNEKLNYIGVFGVVVVIIAVVLLNY